jgi:hypothetical protein
MQTEKEFFSRDHLPVRVANAGKANAGPRSQPLIIFFNPRNSNNLQPKFSHPGKRFSNPHPLGWKQKETFMLDHTLSAQQLAVICALSSGANMTAAAQQAGVHRNSIANWRRNFLPFQRALADAQYDRALYFREKVEDLVDLAIRSLHKILTDPKASPSIKLRTALAVLQTATTPPAPKKQIELAIENIVVQQTPTSEPVHNDAQPEPEICVNSHPFAANSPEPAPPSAHNDAQPAKSPIMHNDAQPEPETCVDPRSFAANSPEPAPPPTHNDAQPAESPIIHNDAQPEPEIYVNSRPFAANSPRRRPEVARNAKCPCGSGKKYKRCCQASPLATAA